ncbi:MAG: MTH938/NDUFAF3 family protein [Pseudomonadota bacterium]
MNLTLDNVAGSYQITACEADHYQIQGKLYPPSLLILPDQLITDWSVANIHDLRSEDLAPVVAHQPDLVLLGTGRTQQFPDLVVLQPLLDAQIGFQVMHNRAACQTYNIVLAEGRQVVLILLGE